MKKLIVPVLCMAMLAGCGSIAGSDAETEAPAATDANVTDVDSTQVDEQALQSCAYGYPLCTNSGGTRPWHRAEAYHCYENGRFIGWRYIHYYSWRC